MANGGKQWIKVKMTTQKGTAFTATTMHLRYQDADCLKTASTQVTSDLTGTNVATSTTYKEATPDLYIPWAAALTAPTRCAAQFTWVMKYIGTDAETDRTAFFATTGSPLLPGA